jgi:tetratricopeptide (TPR) repeat protein
MTRKIIYTALLISILSLIGFYLMLDVPFGILFNGVFYTFLISTVSVFVLLSYTCIQATKKWKKFIGYLLSLVSLALLIVSILFVIDYRILLNGELNPKLTPEEWSEDLSYLTEQMEGIHPDLFSMVSEKVFKDEVKELHTKLPLYDDNKTRAEFLRILALPNDGHTMPDIQSFDLDWHIYPLNVFYFNDGIYVTDAGRGNQDLIGSKILKIGNTDVNEVYTRLKKYLGSESEQHSKSRLAIILLSEWLFAEGLIDDTGNVPFELQKINGETVVVRLNPIHYLPYFYWTLIRKVENNAHPAITNDRKDNYWFEYWPEKKVFYLQFNACMEDEDKPVSEFISQLDQAVKSKPFEKFILDIRNNNGGAVHLLHPIADYFIQNKDINQSGKFYVLTSRKTFSAAVLFASILERNTKAIFVGEPTAQAPFQRGAGSPQMITLPNSGLKCLVSRMFLHASFAMDKRLSLIPEIRLPFTIEDFMSNRDNVLETVLNFHYTPKAAVNLDQEDLDRMKGRYLFSEGHVLTIMGDVANTEIEITDFLENSLQYTRSALYKDSEDLFSTDISNFVLSTFPEDVEDVDSLKICWGDSCKTIVRLPDDYKLPMELFKLGDIKTAIAEAKKNISYFKSLPYNMENYFNGLGYKYLKEDQIDLAISIFQLNVELYPLSANAYDSYGEALLKNGEKDLAIINYQRSLELNPNNTNARKVLSEL